MSLELRLKRLLRRLLPAGAHHVLRRVAHGWRLRRAAGRSPTVLFGGFALVYLGFLTAAQARTSILPLGDRYLSPAYLPLLFVAVFTLDRLLVQARGGKLPRGIAALAPRGTIRIERGKLAALVVALLLALWLGVSARQNVTRIRRANEEGMGFTGPAWAQSEVLRHIRDGHVDGPLYSNATRVIDFYTEHNEYELLAYESCGVRQQLEQAAEGVHVVWHDYVFSVKFKVREEALRALPELALVAELEDGVIFRVDAAKGVGGGAATTCGQAGQ